MPRCCMDVVISTWANSVTPSRSDAYNYGQPGQHVKKDPTMQAASLDPEQKPRKSKGTRLTQPWNFHWLPTHHFATDVLSSDF